MERGLDAGIGRLAVLEHPLRRRLYEHVRDRAHPVTRDDAADAVEISRGLAAFHLDKLVEAGLLRARHDRPPDHGPGPGRHPKRYEPSGVEVVVSVPERRYDLAGRLLADAIAAAGDDEPVTAVLERLAREEGREHARATAASSGEPHPASALVAVLAELGFEPFETDGDGVRLRNCPFHSLAERQTQLVCGMNLEFVGGILEGVRDLEAHAVLDPSPDACCVRIVGGATT